jgi:sporulation protein YlmC with PRC-barrel domain
MQDNAVFNHRTVIDPAGHKVGTVSDVVSDAATLEPRWLIVDTGLLRTSHYVPVTGAEHTPDGDIQVPFDKATVLHAVKAHGSHVLSTNAEADLQQYYGLTG